MLSGRKLREFASGSKRKPKTSRLAVSPRTQPRNESQELLRRQAFAAGPETLKACCRTDAAAEASMPAVKLDGCITDPESNIEPARDWFSNMRSKCRCSCVLQFTFRRAVSCVLHRPPSQVIHCTVLYFKHFKCLHLGYRRNSLVVGHPITGWATANHERAGQREL